MAMRLKKEGLHPDCTAKGSHADLKGTVAHVAIAYIKGVVLREQYGVEINWDMFSDFIKTQFQETFSPCRIPKDKRFLQD